VSIICGNALESDLSTATAVFLYLLPKGMSRLLQKLQAELQPGCKVITYMFRYRGTVLEIRLPSICKHTQDLDLLRAAEHNSCSQGSLMLHRCRPAVPLVVCNLQDP